MSDDSDVRWKAWEEGPKSDVSDDKRRQHDRVDAHVPVRISTIEPDTDPLTGKTYFRASHEYCANLSRGGAFVRTVEPIDPGRRVLVELSLPGGAQVEAIGRVAWTKRVLGESEADSGIGIEFLGTAADQLAALEDFVKHSSDDEPDH